MSIETKRGRRVLRLTLAVVAFVAIFAFVCSVAAADEFAPKFGSFYKEYDTCGCGQLNGTEASIEPTAMDPGSGYCTVFRSAADNTGVSSYLIQAGIAECHAQKIDGPACGYGVPFLFVETETPANGFVCHFHGQTSLSLEHWAGVINGWQNQWQAFIDGNDYESLTGVTGMFRIHEGAEASHPGNDCTGFGNNGPNVAVWAADPVWPWQRFSYANYQWYTIQQSSVSAGCWTLTGGPPNSFTIAVWG